MRILRTEICSRHAMPPRPATRRALNCATLAVHQVSFDETFRPNPIQLPHRENVHIPSRALFFPPFFLDLICLMNFTEIAWHSPKMPFNFKRSHSSLTFLPSSFFFHLGDFNYCVLTTFAVKKIAGEGIKLSPDFHFKLNTHRKRLEF